MINSHKQDEKIPPFNTQNQKTHPFFFSDRRQQQTKTIILLPLTISQRTYETKST